MSRKSGGASYEHSVENPIINSPFAEPKRHWLVRENSAPTQLHYRREAGFHQRGTETKAMFDTRTLDPAQYKVHEEGGLIEFRIVMAIRKALQEWRDSGYDGATRITRQLLEHWRSETRSRNTYLFFAQIEAAETIIFLAEAPELYRRDVPAIPSDAPNEAAQAAGTEAFTRYACKMATGAGKTTVMGMLAAWSILNAKRNPRDERFSDTILVVCPNVTIRGRLQELDPKRMDGSIYVTRDLVPSRHRSDLAAHSSVMISNWHRLALKKSTGGLPEGEASPVVMGGAFESPEAWIDRVVKDLNGSRASSRSHGKWLIFNDEAHHAYRHGEGHTNRSRNMNAGLGDNNIVKEFKRQATIWVEGLDRINSLQGVTMCVDMSATPFYLQHTGNELGKPFPWIVSDFGLLDAIESGMTKIPQLPAQDQSGALDAAYFNIWRWVQDRAEADGHGKKIANRPDLVVKYASQPISMLAGEWDKAFEQWRKDAEKNGSDFVPPIFIVVCSSTAVAKAIHKWITTNPALPKFHNQPGKDVTVQIDSSMMKKIEDGGESSSNDKDNDADFAKRLRFILDTAGKQKWPGGKPPDEWVDYVLRYNRGAENDDSIHRISEAPPGRNVRCIVSVSMLSEGWDANNVTHIVGLRPFGSQLFCEQVAGRALRRKSYDFDDSLPVEDIRLSEEIATVCGVPFELVPFKASPDGGKPHKPRPQRIVEADPNKADFRIEIPVFERRTSMKSVNFDIDWGAVQKVTLDPDKIPAEFDAHPNLAHEGRLAKNSPGKKQRITLEEWRKMHRQQSVAFMLADRVCKKLRRALEASDLATPMHAMFPPVVDAASRFLDDREKLVIKGNGDPRDVLANEDYAERATQSLFNAFESAANGMDGERERAIVSHVLSTDDVCHPTSKEVWEPIEKCHLNMMIADTKTWEQSAAYYLESHPKVIKWVKTGGTRFSKTGGTSLGEDKFILRYYLDEKPRTYEPDFVAVVDNDLHLVIEIKGREIAADKTDSKAKANERWARDLTALGDYGRWEYMLVGDPHNLTKMIDEAIGRS